MRNLFRDEVAKSGGEKINGDVLLTSPPGVLFFSTLSLLIVLTITCFLFFGTFTRREKVNGVLEPKLGVMRLTAQESGKLKMLNIKQGQRVKKGQVLLVFETEKLNTQGIAIEKILGSKLSERLYSVNSELVNTQKLQKNDLDEKKKNLTSLKTANETLNSQLGFARNRINVAEQIIDKYTKLSVSGFVSDTTVQEKKYELMEQQLRLGDLIRLQLSNENEISRLTREITDAPAKNSVREEQMRREISIAEGEYAIQVANHEWSVVAPVDGYVGSLNVTSNQAVAANSILITIVPADDVLIATLYAPSRALGFIRIKQKVRIGLDAFPYQKYGFLTGYVAEIANTPSSRAEQLASSGLGITSDSLEPSYRIQISPTSQTITVSGEKKTLRAGMQLTAEIELESRKLCEWLFAPIESIKTIQ